MIHVDIKLQLRPISHAFIPAMLNRLHHHATSQPVQQQTILIDGKDYPATIQGTGPIALVSVGGATLVQRTFSPHCKTLFTHYATDLYWTKAYCLPDPSTLTLERMAEDILKVVQALGLSEYILLGHSCFGLLALEAAKMQPPGCKGIIMVASPRRVDAVMVAKAEAYFETHADSDRKANDRLRKAEYQRLRKPGDSELSFAAYSAQTARFWGDYAQINDKFLTTLWEGLTPDDALWLHFQTLLCAYDETHHMEAIRCPVLLLGGQADYDSVPLLGWQGQPLPPDFSLVDCGPVGHWPQIEDPAVFDEGLENWLRVKGLLKPGA